MCSTPPKFSIRFSLTSCHLSQITGLYFFRCVEVCGGIFWLFKCCCFVKHLGDISSAILCCNSIISILHSISATLVLVKQIEMEPEILHWHFKSESFSNHGAVFCLSLLAVLAQKDDKMSRYQNGKKKSEI